MDLIVVLSFRIVKALSAASHCLKAAYILAADQSEVADQGVQDLLRLDWTYIQQCLGCSDSSGLPTFIYGLQGGLHKLYSERC